MHEIADNERLRVVLCEPAGSSGLLLERAFDKVGIDVVAHCDCYLNLTLAVRRRSPDIVLLAAALCGADCSIPDALRADFPLIPVVVVTAAYDDAELLRVLRAGVRGYLLRDTPPRSMARALFGVLAGEPALPRALVARVLDELRGHEPGRPRIDRPHGRLTEREWDVLELLGQGLHTDLIAHRLFISPVTVRQQLRRVHRGRLPVRPGVRDGPDRPAGRAELQVRRVQGRREHPAAARPGRPDRGEFRSRDARP